MVGEISPTLLELLMGMVGSVAPEQQVRIVGAAHRPAVGPLPIGGLQACPPAPEGPVGLHPFP